MWLSRMAVRLILDGKPVHFNSPLAAKTLGISTVFQELSLIPKMSVADNIWLGREPLKSLGSVNRKEVRARTAELLNLFTGMFKTEMHPDLPVADLHPDEKQIVEILKAVSFNPKLLILDEATASLDSRQVQRLFELVRKWKTEDKAIVFISHRMEEIFQIADRYTVLRNGRTVGTGNMSDANERDFVKLMVDKDSVFKYARAGAKSSEKPICIEAQDLHSSVLRGVSFEVREGELIGIGGLQGQGQRDLLLSIFGDIPFSGTLKYRGKQVHFNHPNKAIKSKIALVPGDRAREGLLYIRSILENIQLPSWSKYSFPLRIQHAENDANQIGKKLNLVMAGLQEPVSSLSGGNAQKVVIGKWLLRQPDLLLLDDPTKGVDVGSKAEFYGLLTQLLEEGKTILFYSSDDEELVGLCDRVLVLHDGKIYTELSGAALTKENLISASLGVVDRGSI